MSKKKEGLKHHLNDIPDVQDATDFEKLNLPMAAVSLQRAMAGLPEKSELGNAAAVLETSVPSLSAAPESDIAEYKKALAVLRTTALESSWLLQSQQDLIEKMAEFETALGNDLARELHRRDRLFIQEIAQTKKRKNLDMWYAIGQRSLSTLAVIVVVIAMLKIATMLEAPVPAVLAPVPADKHFSPPTEPGNPDPVAAIDSFINRLWR